MTNNASTPPTAPPALPQNTSSGTAHPGGVAPPGPSPEEVNYLIQHLSQILIRLTDGLTPK